MAAVNPPIFTKRPDTDMNVEVVVQMTKLTQQNKLIWEAVAVLSSDGSGVLHDSLKAIHAAIYREEKFSGHYKGFTYLFTKIDRFVSRNSQLMAAAVAGNPFAKQGPGWETSYRLTLVNEDLSPNHIFPEVEGLKGLYTAIQRQLSKVDFAVKSLFDDDEVE